ncbi:uncharacterized protein [Palaemon carinicauda]|uniref:uncharacterized protein n=1 Tax=Palaemon carinicauda TaxID=392227 RepID=UPI0035B6833F
MGPERSVRYLPIKANTTHKQPQSLPQQQTDIELNRHVCWAHMNYGILKKQSYPRSQHTAPHPSTSLHPDQSQPRLISHSYTSYSAAVSNSEIPINPIPTPNLPTPIPAPPSPASKEHSPPPKPQRLSRPLTRNPHLQTKPYIQTPIPQQPRSPYVPMSLTDLISSSQNSPA